MAGLTVSIIILLWPLVHIPPTVASQCACATATVHVRNGAGVGHTILTTLQVGHCLTFNGHRQTVSGASWVNVDYHGQNGWIHSGYVRMSTCAGGSHTAGHSVQLPGCPRIITRAEWGARGPSHGPIDLTHTPKYMFVHHGASPPCHTKAECIHKVRAYQNYHMDGHRKLARLYDKPLVLCPRAALYWPDIGYSFVVGEDGNVYEARGWDQVGAHTYGYNSVGLAICVIGDFTNRAPNQAALDAVRKMIDCGLANHKLTSTYMLRGHRDVGATSCPGNKLYALIKHWPHY